MRILRLISGAFVTFLAWIGGAILLLVLAAALKPEFGWWLERLLLH